MTRYKMSRLLRRFRKSASICGISNFNFVGPMLFVFQGFPTLQWGLGPNVESQARKASGDDTESQGHLPGKLGKLLG